MEAAPQGSRLPVGVARALPSGWPRPLLPLAPQAHLLPIRCTEEQRVQHEAEEDEARLQLLLPSSQDHKKKVSLCPCRRTDDSIFMLACDECDRWFHGECVGVTEEEAEAVAKWVCKYALSVGSGILCHCFRRSMEMMHSCLFTEGCLRVE